MTSASSTDSSRAAMDPDLGLDVGDRPSRTALPMSTDERLADVCWS